MLNYRVGLAVLLLAFVAGAVLIRASLPDWAHGYLVSQLQQQGYEKVSLAPLSWSPSSYFALTSASLEATGESVPDLNISRLEFVFDLSQLWRGRIAAVIQGDIWDGHLINHSSYSLFTGTTRLRAKLENIQLAALKKLLPLTANDELTGLLSISVSIHPQLSQTWQLQANAKQITLKSKNGYQMLISGINIENSQLSFADSPQIHVTKAVASGLSLHQQTTPLLQLEKLELSGFEYGESLSLETIVAKQLWLGKDEQTLGKWSEIAIQGLLRKQPRTVSAKSISMKGVELQADKTAEGMLATWKLWQQNISKEQPETESAKEEKEKPWQFKLQQFNLSDTQLAFTDSTTKPAVNLLLKVSEGNISNLTNLPSESDTTWKALGTIGELGSWQSSGSTSGADWQRQSQAVIEFKAMPLAPLTPYFIDRFGSGIQSGNCDIYSQIAVKEGNINISGTILARKLNLKSAGDISTVSSTWALDSALDSLRDTDNNITLDFQADGLASDPQFRLGKVWDKVLKEAINYSAITYLSQTMQPYGLAVAVGNMIYERSKKVELRSLAYLPHTLTLDKRSPDLAGYSAKIVDLLNAKPALVLEICPYYLEEEKEEGEKLSQQRLRTLTEKLAELGLINERISICEPTLDKSNKARSRLALRLI